MALQEVLLTKRAPIIPGVFYLRSLTLSRQKTQLMCSAWPLNPKNFNKCLLSESTETIAYIGIQDFRYWVLELASIKTGHPLLLPSPRNALPNTISLLDVTGCKVLCYSDSLKEQAVALSKLVKDLTIIQLPKLEDMINGNAIDYPYNKTWEEAKDDIILIVHTSGSTGVPKPIYYTHKLIGAGGDNREIVPSVPGSILANLGLLKRKKPFFAGTPFFHISGILLGFITMFGQTTLVMGPSDVPPSGKILRDIARSVNLNGMIIVPSLIEAMLSEDLDELLPTLAKLEHICWLGGPLGTSTGDWISKNMKANLWQLYGSTEMVGAYQLIVPPRSHWQYMKFHPVVGPTLERLAPNSDFYEVVSHPKPNNEWSQPVLYMFPDKDEWRSKDIFSQCKDPGCEDLWKYEGRSDDMMLLSNGLKVNPVHIETRIQGHHALKGCLVVGYGYTKCGLLIEPKADSFEKTSVVEQVWPAVEEANSFVPEHARIEKKMVIVADPRKPFTRASKGTVIRSLTTQAYESEIKLLYGIAD